MKNTKEFGLAIKIKVNSSNIEIYSSQEADGKVTYKWNFDANFVYYLKMCAQHVWKDFEPRMADSEGSDYDEYYDSKLDSNGYCTLITKKIYAQIIFDPPCNDRHLLYKFNKRRIESFVFDLEKDVVDKEKGIIK